MSITRREVLGIGAAAVAGAVLAPGMRLVDLAQARPPQETASSLQRWGILVDASKCADGCNACVTACRDENGWAEQGSAAVVPQWIRNVTLKDVDTGYSQSIPVMCQHCESPPCVDVCPTGASFKRADGIVLVDKHICIGCRYCMMACPYKARSFEHEDVTGQKSYAPRGKGTVEACTFCVQRIDDGRIPACVEACDKDGGKAMYFGDLKDPNSEIAKRLASTPSTQLRPDLNLNTGIRYQGI